MFKKRIIAFVNFLPLHHKIVQFMKKSNYQLPHITSSFNNFNIWKEQIRFTVNNSSNQIVITDMVDNGLDFLRETHNCYTVCVVDDHYTDLFLFHCSILDLEEASRIYFAKYDHYINEEPSYNDLKKILTDANQYFEEKEQD